MAGHMTKADIAAQQVKDYPVIRTALKSGDLFFTSGNYLISKAIQEVTSSPWSHVGIIFVIPSIDRVLLLESVEDMGVRFAPLSKYLSDYEGKAPYKGMIVTATVAGVENAALANLAQMGVDQLTRPYDKAEIGRILARVILGKGKLRRDKEYICSELVYECFINAGISLNTNPKGFVSPEDIWQDPRVTLAQRIL
uniref:Permuted papain-like amidase enzyme, YaeF/YiiX, C92 family n=1 Tax=Nitratidesulfovibrio vulgaris (strain DSM 19637 / Miyazaki F) TaxID=883 RepID=B8DIP7_NITV9